MLYTNHKDSGPSYVFFDCAFKPLESTDSKGAQVVSLFDEFQRPLKAWAKNNAGKNFTLRSLTHYGDGSITEEIEELSAPAIHFLTVESVFLGS